MELQVTISPESFTPDYWEKHQKIVDLAIEKRMNQKPSRDPEELITRKHVKTEYKISYPTLHLLMRDGKLAFQKLGRKTLFRRADVEACFKK